MPGVAIYGAFLHLDTKINKYMCCQFQNNEKNMFFCKLLHFVNLVFIAQRQHGWLETEKSRV